MPISSARALAAALRGAQKLVFCKTAGITTVGGTHHSMWSGAGNPVAGTLTIGDTSAGLIPTSTTTGALPFVNAAGGKTQYIGAWNWLGPNADTYILYDRLWHAGSFSAVATTTFNLASQPALTRPDANGVGAEIWIEVNAAFTSTVTTITVTYTNQAGTAGQASTMTQTIQTTGNGRMYPLSLVAGDTGVRKVESIVVGGTGDATGTFNVLILRRVATLVNAISVGFGGVYGGTLQNDALSLGFASVLDNACLALLVVTNSTSSGSPMGELHIISD